MGEWVRKETASIGVCPVSGPLLGTVSTLLKLPATLRAAVTRSKSHTNRADIKNLFWLQNSRTSSSCCPGPAGPSVSLESGGCSRGRTAQWRVTWALQSVSRGFHLGLSFRATWPGASYLIFLCLSLLMWARPRECQATQLTTGASQVKTLPLPLSSNLCPASSLTQSETVVNMIGQKGWKEKLREKRRPICSSTTANIDLQRPLLQGCWGMEGRGRAKSREDLTLDQLVLMNWIFLVSELRLCL